jgi:zinc D-Ala-D-Ala carboxypeptidase
MKLGKHFDLSEFCTSQTAARYGIDMTPPESVIDNLRMLVVNILDPLRELLDRPIVISSGYRPSALNVAIGGALRSQHVAGQAADILVPGMSVLGVCRTIIANPRDCPYDQLIFEFGQWTHVSYSSTRCRHAVLTATRYGQHVTYTPGLPE